MKKNAWIFKLIILTFIITIIFSVLSDLVLSNTGIIIGIVLIFLFVFIGVIFDMIGIAVAGATDRSFHAMASKTKHSSIDTAKKLIKNSSKVSAVCNDVIGDICNIMSGTAAVVISVEIAAIYSLNFTVSLLIITSFVAAITIGGKAFGKDIAINNKDEIIMKVAMVISKIKTS